MIGFDAVGTVGGRGRLTGSLKTSLNSLIRLSSCRACCAYSGSAILEVALCSKAVSSATPLEINNALPVDVFARETKRRRVASRKSVSVPHTKGKQPGSKEGAMAAMSSTLLSSEVMSAFDKKTALVAKDAWPDEIDFSNTFGPYVIPK